MKRSCQPDLIHINGLPEDLLREIQIHLPIKDAVRTSVLSSKWRYVWTKLPYLIFDDGFCKGLIMNTKSKLIQAIYQVLLLHHGPLDVFKLSFSDLESCPETDQFVLAVLKAGVKDFTLQISEAKPFILHSSIFAYGQQLEALDLSFCILKPPLGFNGFSKLVYLWLKEVGITGSAFSSLISNCPLLESLFFESYSSYDCLDIVAPNLEEFNFVGYCKSLCFVNTPKLKIVSVVTHYVEYDKLKDPTLPSQCKLRGRLPVVEELWLDHCYSKYMAENRAPRSLVNDLYQLDDLHLVDFCFRFTNEVSSALCLIKNATYLEKLTVALAERNQNKASEVVELTEVEGYSEVTLDFLKKFEFLEVSGSKCELQFIELILLTSPLLEKLHIKPSSMLVGKEGLKFSKELLRLQRSLPHIEMDYKV